MIIPPIKLQRVKEIQKDVILEGNRLLDKAIGIFRFHRNPENKFKLSDPKAKKTTQPAKDVVIFSDPTELEITDIDLSSYQDLQELRRYGDMKEFMLNQSSIEKQKTAPYVNVPMQLLYTIDPNEPIKSSLPFTMEQFGSAYQDLQRKKSLNEDEKGALVCFNTLFDLSESMLQHYKNQTKYEEQGIARTFALGGGGDESKTDKIDMKKEFDLVSDHFFELSPFIAQSTDEYQQKYNSMDLPEGAMLGAVDQLLNCHKSGGFNAILSDQETRQRRFPIEVTPEKQSEDLDLWITKAIVPFGEKLQQLVKEHHIKEFTANYNLRNLTKK